MIIFAFLPERMKEGKKAIYQIQWIYLARIKQCRGRGRLYTKRQAFSLTMITKKTDVNMRIGIFFSKLRKLREFTFVSKAVVGKLRFQLI